MRHRSLSWRLLLWLLLAALLLALLPLLLLAPYDVPCADDFSYGAAARAAWRESRSLFAVLRAAGQVAAETYRTWQGSFSAIFLMALQPAVFGESLYALTPVLMLAALLIGLFCLCGSLFHRVFGLPRSFAACTAALLALFSTQLLPYPVESLYWYNGSVYYTFFFALSLTAFALAIPTVREGGAARIALLCLLCLVIGGGSYATALNVAVVLLSITLLEALLKKAGWKRLIPPLAALLLSFGLSVAAPGNRVRLLVGLSPLQAVAQSFVHGARFSVKLFTLPMLGLLLLLLALFLNAAPERHFRFRLPGLVTLYSFCLFSALFTPTLYAQNRAGDGRMLDVIFYAYVLLLALNLFYWVGWLRGRLRPKGDGTSLPLSHALLAVLLCLACCALALHQGQSFTSLTALGSLRSGEAARYRAIHGERLALLEDDAVRDPALPYYSSAPYLLFFDDVTVDPDAWENTAAAAYYGKDSVVLKID